jgi:hypothetical protein
MDEPGNDFEAAVAAIRLAVGKQTGARWPRDAERPVDLVDQGDRMVRHYEGWLLDEEQKQTLDMQPGGRFLLYASSYLCDIGLAGALGIPPLPEGLKDDRAQAFDPRSLSTRSCQLIRDDCQGLGLPDKASAGVITRVCLQAAAADGDHCTPAEPGAAAACDATVNVPLLAACLRLSRAIDLKSPAAILRITSFLPGGSRISPAGLDACFRVVDAGAHPSVNGTIRIQIQCSHPDVHRALKHHERHVQRLLEKLNQHVRPRFLYSDLLYEIEPEGYTPIDLRFAVDSSAGLQLFMGNRLYADKRVFLRELIQNAVDACNFRKLGEPHYRPAIAIEFNDNVSTVTVRDNGIGMTRQWIEKYFLAIGISFYQSNEIRNVNRDPRIDFSFISQFGIGFLSSFQVADRIVIKTRKASFPGLMITISGLRDYFDVTLLEDDCPVGTEVTLHLRESQIRYCRRVEFAGYLKTNVRFLKVPVELTDGGGNTTTVGREQLAYDTDKRAGTVFVAPLDLLESEGYVRLGAKSNGTNIYALEVADGGASVFQDGIFVTQLAALLPEGARQHVVARINLAGRDKCELSDVDDLMHDRLPEPIRRLVEKRFRDFVRINYAHALKRKGIAEADDYNEAWQQEVLRNLAGK